MPQVWNPKEYADHARFVTEPGAPLMELLAPTAGERILDLGCGDGVLTKREMKPGDAVHVTPKTVHRMTAIEDADVFEASTPELHDVVRLEDRYGRTDK